LVATGRLGDFRTAFGHVRHSEDGLILSTACAAALGVDVGDAVTWVARI
jgi:arginine N-succinyltransferase